MKTAQLVIRKKDFTGTIQNLLLFTLACTPLFALREYLKFSGYTLPGYTLYFNFFKDLLLLIIAGLCAVQLFIHKKYPVLLKPYFIFFSAFTLLVIVLSFKDKAMVAAGLRWCLPLFLIFLLAGHITRLFLHRLSVVVNVVMVLNTIAQLHQVATHHLVWGSSTYLSMFGRVPGFFELPSIAGFFSCLCFYLTRYFFDGPSLAKKILLVISIFSTLFLSISTTGFFIIILLLFFPLLYRPGRYRPVYIAIALAVGLLLYYRLDMLNGRYEGDASVSWNIRVQLFKDQLHYVQFISDRFGHATNTVSILKAILGQPIDKSFSGGGESFYPTVLGNYGVLLFVLFLGVLVFLLIKALMKRNEASILFLLIALMGCVTVRFTETFPINVLLPILSAYFICPQYYKTRSGYG